jgi:hypothetical protein
MLYQILISFTIYALTFCSIENIVCRIDSEGIKRLSLMPIFTEGLIAPIRSLYLLLRYNSIRSFLSYIIYLIINLNNIFGSTIFVFYILAIIENNFK